MQANNFSTANIQQIDTEAFSACRDAGCTIVKFAECIIDRVLKSSAHSVVHIVIASQKIILR